MHEYHYTIDKQLHQIQSTDPIDLADANGCIPISTAQNKICKQLKALLCEWIRFTKKNDIHWNAMAGTLLGIVRDKGLIFYDNDIDVAISYDELERVNTIRNKVGSEYELRKIEQGFQLSYKNKPFPFIDVFLLNDDPFDKTKVMYTDRLNMYGTHVLFPKEHFAKVDIINNKQALYEGILCNVPANAEQYAKQIYGDDALTRYVVYTGTNFHTTLLGELWMTRTDIRDFIIHAAAPIGFKQLRYFNVALATLISYNIASTKKVDLKKIYEITTRLIEINIKKLRELRGP